MAGGGVVFGQFLLQLVLDLLDQGVALELGVLLGVERVLEAVADLGVSCVAVGLVELGRGDGALGLAGLGDELFDARRRSS